MLSIFNPTYREPSIWAFDEIASRRQTVFDLIFGVITPILCFLCDPVVISGWFTNGRGVVPHGKAIYIFSGFTILLLLIQLVFKKKSTNLNGICAGIFYTGAILSLSAGIILLPFSFLLFFLMLAFLLEGLTNLSFNLDALKSLLAVTSFFLLSLTPLFTAFVYWRNGSRSAHTARINISGAHLKGLALSAIISLISISIFFQLKIENETENAVAAIVQSSDGRNENAVLKLKIMSWTPNFSSADLDSLIQELRKTDNVERQENLAKSYSEITGISVVERIEELNY